jgi:hypothetical protein
MARKHKSQMSKDELGFVVGYIRANATRLWSANGHFFDRASERHFTLDAAKDAAAKGVVVEVHNDRNPDVRALVRNAAGTCVVISLKSWEVITVYYNDPADAHDTLNWNAYRWQESMVTLVKNLRRA